MTSRPALAALVGAVDASPGEAMKLLSDYRAEVAHEFAVEQGPTKRVLQEVLAERVRQDERWGEQNHGNGTGLPVYQHSARRYRDAADRNAAAGVLAWRDVLLEEVHEALAESDPVRLRAELVQVAAVAVVWIESIDRKLKKEGSDAQADQ